MFTNPFDKEDSITESSLFYPAAGSPGATVFQFVHLKNIPYGGILKTERTRRR